MKKRYLGKTGIKVSELCFGALPIGPLQANISLEEAAKLIRTALEKGINFIDTAEAYKTYPHIKLALEGYSGEVIIASKSVAKTYSEMEKSINDTRQSLGRSFIDIFHLHAARSAASVFEERAGAWQCLKDYKAKGILRAIGISTHSIETVKRAKEIEEVDIIFPLVNLLGMGIIDGDVQEMIKAIKEADQAGKGIYAMKALAGGHLINRLEEALNFVRNISGISSIAVGMLNQKELELNIHIFKNKKLPPGFNFEHLKPGKSLFIANFCKGCGECVKVCPNQALSLREGKAVVDKNLCILCGYCQPACPEFAIRLI